MKQKSASSKIYAIFIALALLVLLAVNVTFSYFSAQKTVTGSASMGRIQIQWINGSWYSGLTNEIQVSAVDKTSGVALENLSRGMEFNLQAATASGGTVNLTNLGLTGTPFKTYARFWVEAYIAGDTTNYGQYFELVIDSSKVTKQTMQRMEDSEAVETNVIYYVNNAISATQQQLSLISGMKLLEDAPMLLLNSTITVTIHLDGVQAYNQAHTKVWNTTTDWKGYLSSWA